MDYHRLTHLGVRNGAIKVCDYYCVFQYLRVSTGFQVERGYISKPASWFVNETLNYNGHSCSVQSKINTQLDKSHLHILCTFFSLGLFLLWYHYMLIFICCINLSQITVTHNCLIMWRKLVSCKNVWHVRVAGKTTAKVGNFQNFVYGTPSMKLSMSWIFAINRNVDGGQCISCRGEEKEIPSHCSAITLAYYFN